MRQFQYFIIYDTQSKIQIANGLLCIKFWQKNDLEIDFDFLF